MKVNRLMPAYFRSRPNLLSDFFYGCVVIATTLWLIRLLFHAVVVSTFWPWFAVICVVYVLVHAVIKHGQSLPAKNRWPIFVAAFASISTITLMLTFITGGFFHILDYADFYFVKEPYLKKIKETPHTDMPRFIAFNEGIGGADESLYFDESDELDRPEQIKSKDWWIRARKESVVLTTTAWESRKVANHFYAIQFTFTADYNGSPIPPLD